MARKTSFYYSFLVLPAEERRAIVAVWDFCRAVDDAVDEGDGSTARQAVQCWRKELDRCFAGEKPETPQGQRLQPFINRFGLPRDAFEDVIDGVAMDLDHTRYQTFDDLFEYCRRVASAVGMICIRIFGCEDERSREYALQLGVALQLTNILRDIKDDLARGRVYLPPLGFAGARLDIELELVGGASPQTASAHSLPEPITVEIEDEAVPVEKVATDGSRTRWSSAPIRERSLPQRVVAVRLTSRGNDSTRVVHFAVRR